MTSSRHSHEERDQEKDPLLPLCRVLEGKEPIAGLEEQLRHPDRTNPEEKLPLERFFPSPRLHFLLPSFSSLQLRAELMLRMEQGGWHRLHAEPQQQPHVFNLLLHERLVYNKAASSGDHSLKRLFI